MNNSGWSVDLRKQSDNDDELIFNKFGREVFFEMKELKGREYCFRRLDLLSQINPRLIPFVKILRKNDNVEKVA